MRACFFFPKLHHFGRKMSKSVEKHIEKFIWQKKEANSIVKVKRKIAVFAVLVAFCGLLVVSYSTVAASPAVNPADLIKNGLALFVSSPVAFVYGQESQVDSTDWKVVPYEKSEQVMVPIRFIAESFGAKVAWDNKNATATVTLGSNKISLSSGSSQIVVGNNSYPTVVPVEIVKNRTFVQAGPFVQALGKKLFYDSGLIIISDGDLSIDPVDQPKVVHKIIMLFNKQYSSSNTDGSELETTITSDDPAIQTILKYYEAVNEQNHIKYKAAASPRLKLIVPDWSTIYRVRLVSIDEQKATVTKQEYLDSLYGKFIKPIDVRIFAVQQEIHNVREPMGVGYFSEAVQNFVLVKLTTDGPWVIDFIGNSI